MKQRKGAARLPTIRAQAVVAVNKGVEFCPFTFILSDEWLMQILLPHIQRSRRSVNKQTLLSAFFSCFYLVLG